MFNRLMKKPFKERLKDTGYLFKHSFTIIGKDKDIKTPTIKMAVYSIIMTTSIFSALAMLFSNALILPGIFILIFTIFILAPFKYFYDVRQKADQSWIVYNTLSGKDISLQDAHTHTGMFKPQLRFISFVTIVMAFSRSQSGEKKGILAVIARIFLAIFQEIWDLLGHYMLPAVVIEQKPLKELIEKIKSLRKNVPATFTGVFGIDFVGNVVKSLFGIIYLILFIIALGIGALIATFTTATVVTIAGFSFSWIPVVIILYISFLIGVIYGRIVESIKVIYFTIFYTAINRPSEIAPSMRGELTHYLLMNGD